MNTYIPFTRFTRYHHLPYFLHILFSIFSVCAEMMTFHFQIFSRHFVKVKNFYTGASLVAQWLRIRLPMQGTRVRALVWEDPTCRGATGPMSHNY